MCHSIVRRFRAAACSFGKRNCDFFKKDARTYEARERNYKGKLVKGESRNGRDSHSWKKQC